MFEFSRSDLHEDPRLLGRYAVSTGIPYVTYIINLYNPSVHNFSGAMVTSGYPKREAAVYNLFIHSIDMCKMRRFLAILRSFFHSSLLCTFFCHLSPPTNRPSSLASSCHLFLGLPLHLVVPKFMYQYNSLLGILFPSILCTCPNQRTVIPRLTSDPANEYFFRCFSDSANEYGFG